MAIISKKQADNIVNEICLDLDYNVNFMDENGIIISSTKPDRVGELHLGAKRILEDNLPEYIVYNSDSDTSMKQGVNLPIVHENRIIGVIGITGPVSEVRKIGNIVKKMTEILINESIEHNNDTYKRRIIYRFVDKWLISNTIKNNQTLIDEGKTININVLIPRRCLVINYMNKDKLNLTLKGQSKMQAMDETIRLLLHKIPKSVYYHLSTEQYLFLPNFSNTEIMDLFLSFSKIIKNKFEESIIGGFDGKEGGSLYISELKEEAYIALTCAKNGQELINYNNLTLEPIINNINENEALLFIERLFKTDDLKSIKQTIEFIDVYFEENGSISKISNRLFIHKNTVQYKIKKLLNETDYDIRIQREAINFFIAKELYIKFVKF